MSSNVELDEMVNRDTYLTLPSQKSLDFLIRTEYFGNSGWINDVKLDVESKCKS